MKPRNAAVWAVALAVGASWVACSIPSGVFYRCEVGGGCNPGFECIDDHCLPVTPEDADGGPDAGEDAGTIDAGSEDGGSDAGAPANAVPVTWSNPQPLGTLNTGASERMPTVTPDQSRICFVSSRASATEDIWCASRAGADFGAPTLQDTLLPGESTEHPELSADGTELFFSALDAGYPDLFRATLSGGRFENAEWILSLGAEGYDTGPSLGGDGRTLYFQSDRAGASGADIYVTTRSTAGTGTDFASPTELIVLSSKGGDREPAVSPDGGYLVYTSDRDAGFGGVLIWLSVREAGGWSQPRAVRLEGITTEVQGLDLADDDTLYFQTRPVEGGDADLFRADPVYPEP
ncbi:MAG: hypothetical protein M3Y59_04800 [Myxococcota bacterium]|nr:hypothetical protein [Myxococcota bacterium]